MGSIQPASEPSGHNVDVLLVLLQTIRRHAFNLRVPPADALIDIRDAVREYDGEFIDEE